MHSHMGNFLLCPYIHPSICTPPPGLSPPMGASARPKRPDFGPGRLILAQGGHIEALGRPESGPGRLKPGPGRSKLGPGGPESGTRSRALRYSRYRYQTLGTLLSTESSVLMSVPRYYRDDEDGDDDGDKTAS